MGVIIRGAKNAFRNVIRTVSVTLILAISIGLALIMFLSYRAVVSRIQSVKSSIGTTISVTPAGAQGFEGGGEPLTGEQLSGVAGLDHVSSVSETLSDRLTAGDNNNLVSAIDAGTLGQRFNRQGGGGQTGGQSRTFTVPISVTGISDPSSLVTGATKLTSGDLFASGSGDNVALVGTALASKNNLTVGSTFTAYGTSIKVLGIFDTGTQFSNAGLYMPLKTVQTLAGEAGQISGATVTVDDIGNVETAAAAIKGKLGADKADVTSSQSREESAIAPLENIRNISLYSLVGALVAGSVITLLTMIMIVRERRREIGVLKAIGSSNLAVVGQFVSEALVLTLMGGIVGVVAGALLSNPVLKALVSGTASPVQQAATGRGGAGGFGRVAAVGGQIGGSLRTTYASLHTAIGPDIILYGLLAAVVIAIIGSALPAWLIASVKPAEVMRGE